MVKYIPPGFDEARVLEGLHRAMGFGEPTRTEDKATFFFVQNSPPAGPADAGGVPFDPTDRPTNVAPTKKKTVTCTVEFFDRAGVMERIGEIRPTRVRVTLLDPQYQEVKGFAYLVAGGDKYLQPKVEPPVALGSIDVWTVWCTAESET